MKRHFLFIFFTISQTTFGQITLSDIQGSWQLEKVESIDSIRKPTKKIYNITFKDSSIGYNLPINACGGWNVKIINDTLKFDGPNCTLICCDERFDPFYANIDYSGHLILSKDTLIIQNEIGYIYLVKKK